MPPSWQQAGWAGAEPPVFLNTSPNVDVSPPRRSTRLRWVIALVGAILIVAAGVGVTVFAVGAQSNASIGPTFLPATTPLYAEARFDLPGAERDNIIKFIAHFPGFADQSSFDTKVDDALDKWVGDVTSNQLLYTRDLKPWFSGQIAVGLLQLPQMMAPGNGSAAGAGASAEPMPTMALGMPGMSGMGSLSDMHLVVGIGVKDRARLDTLIATARSMASDVTFTEQPNGDRTIVSVSSNGTAQGAYVVTDKMLLIAPSADDLSTALAVVDGTTPSLANDPAYTSATANLPADRLGEVYAGPAYYQAFDSLLTNVYSGAMGTDPRTAGILQCVQVKLTDPANASSAGAIVVAPDNLSVQSTITNAFSLPVGTSTDLAAHVPQSSMVYLQVPNVGPAVHDLVSCLRTNIPDAFSDKNVQTLEQALGNPLEDEFSFVGDLALSVGFDGQNLQWGLVGTVTDDATAQERLTTLVSILRAAAAAGSAPLTVANSTDGDTTVSTITFTDPSMAKSPVGESVSIALKDGHIYIGGGDFTTTAMNVTETDSLGGSDRYTTAMAAAGNPNSVQLYVDVSGVRQLAEAMMRAGSDYTTNIQPYLMPFDRFVLGTSQNGTTASSQMVLFVK